MRSSIVAACWTIALLVVRTPGFAEEPEPAPVGAPEFRTLLPMPASESGAQSPELFQPREKREHILWTVMRNRADRDGIRLLRRSTERQFGDAPEAGARLLDEADRVSREQGLGNGSRLDLIEAGREPGSLGKFGGFLPAAVSPEQRSVMDGGFWSVDDDLRLRLDIYHLADRLGARALLPGGRASGEEQAAAGTIGAALRELPVRVDVDVRVDLRPTQEAMDDDSVVSSCEGRLRFRWIPSEAAGDGGVEGLLRYEWKPRQPAELSLNFVKSF